MLITGASGFLGSRVAQYYKDKYEVLTPSHSEMDIADESSVMQYFKKARPDFIIHCAAISDVGRCEREPELSWNINVVGTENVVKAAKEISAKCVCCSSDQVYIGSMCIEAHQEDEVLAPTNVYGKEKLLKPVRSAGLLPALERGCPQSRRCHCPRHGGAPRPL